MPIPSHRLPKPAGGYGERRRQSVFRVIRACIRGQLAPLSNFPYPNGEQLQRVHPLTTHCSSATLCRENKWSGRHARRHVNHLCCFHLWVSATVHDDRAAIIFVGEGEMSHLELAGLSAYPESRVDYAGSTYFMTRGERMLGVIGESAGFEGTRHEASGALLCPLTPANAAALRRRLPWLNPVPLGLRTSAGFGDRLGLATPGHVLAVRGTGIAPVFAQQSVRENARTHRTPQQVLDDAMWGVFQAGWREPWGADADHLKTPADAEAFAAAGYTFYTIDPGDHVDNAADTDPAATLTAKVDTLPWDILDSSAKDLEERYLKVLLRLGRFNLYFDRPVLLRAAAKYGRAVAHTVTMYRHLRTLMGRRPWELEVSVDETATPTTVQEHF